MKELKGVFLVWILFLSFILCMLAIFLAVSNAIIDYVYKCAELLSKFVVDSVIDDKGGI